LVLRRPVSFFAQPICWFLTFLSISAKTGDPPPLLLPFRYITCLFFFLQREASCPVPFRNMLLLFSLSFPGGWERERENSFLKKSVLISFLLKNQVHVHFEPPPCSPSEPLQEKSPFFPSRQVHPTIRFPPFFNPRHFPLSSPWSLESLLALALPFFSPSLPVVIFSPTTSCTAFIPLFCGWL